MYRAKHSGRNRISIFDDKLKLKVTEEELLERELKRALREKLFFVVYQPQFRVESVDSRRLVGFEALFRVRSGKLSDVPVNRLITIAEESGIVGEITYAVTEEVCRFLKRFQGDVRVSINVSYYDLVREDFPEMMEKIVSSFGVAPSKICLEITERVFVGDFSVVRGILQDLKKRGFRISIDDFGTGYSCLSYLQHLPIEEVKVDRSFIKNVNLEPKKRGLTKGIVMLARSLGIEPVAEGVEKEGELKELLSFGCNLFQGYFFSPPLKEEEIWRGDVLESFHQHSVRNSSHRV
jgi:EAL domain-containing protein (putative c-di-GMP-specific phosphodiesterase class I)